MNLCLSTVSLFLECQHVDLGITLRVPPMAYANVPLVIFHSPEMPRCGALRLLDGTDPPNFHLAVDVAGVIRTGHSPDMHGLRDVSRFWISV